MAIRRRGASPRRRFEVSLDLLSLLANMRACTEARGARGLWETFWDSPEDGRAAFGALRHHQHGVLGSTLGAEEGDSYNDWFTRLGPESRKVA